MEPSTTDVAARRPGRPRSADADAAITTAVLQQILQHGYHNLSLDRVAEAAGVSKATIYRRWSSKEEVVVAAFAASAAGIELDRESDDIEALRVCYLRLAAVAAGPAGELLVHLAGAATKDDRLRDAMTAFGDAQRAPVLASIALLQARGELDPDVEPRLVADALAGVLFYRRMIGMPALTPAQTSRVFDAVVAGFRPAAG